MHFEIGYLYHIYNQGNNRQKIFFNQENYFFFLRKFQTHILPFADIIAWCLMPNHFHLMIHVNQLICEGATQIKSSEIATLSGALTNAQKQTSINDSIGKMLSSYTRAINRQEERTGALFRSKTKAECLTNLDGLTKPYYLTQFGTQINVQIPEEEYPTVCFNYIHYNPVKAGLVKNLQDWEFSSYKDYYSNRGGKFVNKEKAKEFVTL